MHKKVYVYNYSYNISSAESQKGINAVHQYSFENQKGTSTIHFVER